MKKLLYLLLAVGAVSCATPPEPEHICPAVDQDVRRNSCVAITEKSLSDHMLFAWADRANFWQKNDNGMVELSVQFLEGTEKQKALAFERFRLVDSLGAGLQVRLAGNGEVGNIRCAFGCSGHWSYLGKTAKSIRAGKATMNIELDSRSPASEWDRVAIHEFLHALGFEHEHQHPNSTIPWNHEAVYQDYAATQGWDRDMVNYQVLNRKVPKDMWTSGFDEKSIMLYPIPSKHTSGRMVVGWNTRLSLLDIALIQTIFPAP